MDTTPDMPTVFVSFPAALYARTGQRRSATASGNTVREVIEVLERDFPGIRFNLCYETGELRRYVNIFLNGENIRYLRGLDTPLTSDMTMYILPSVAGG
jgi:molybdopterin synthase sulfur carrier subunit